MKKLRILSSLILAVVLALSGLNIPTTSAAVVDYVNVTRSVNPTTVISGEEAEVALNIQGTPPVLSLIHI
ncbi:hypothetical protein QK887_25770 [Salmonella enterica subsp. enterica serovar Oslo]|nr:hypothetical protein [Salmonella enterica]MDT1800478.1 hypothetical protein [Salmonella enterica subsp. enterica serovar Oslo]